MPPRARGAVRRGRECGRQGGCARNASCDCPRHRRGWLKDSSGRGNGRQVHLFLGTAPPPASPFAFLSHGVVVLRRPRLASSFGRPASLPTLRGRWEGAPPRPVPHLLNHVLSRPAGFFPFEMDRGRRLASMLKGGPRTLPLSIHRPELCDARWPKPTARGRAVLEFVGLPPGRRGTPRRSGGRVSPPNRGRFGRW